jgi:DNA helicase HerA-like ATPase
MMLGRISGSVTTKDFSFKAEAKVKKLQYVAVKDYEGKWILSYVDSITNYMNNTVAKAKVIGFRDSRNFLKPLAIPFEPGTPVYLADDELIKMTLGLKDDGLYMGILEGYNIPVNLPVKHLITKHVAILAKTGTGKSYAAGVLLEELAEKNIPAVIIDPHGEYRTLVEENKKENEVSQMKRFGIEPRSYKDKIQVFDLGVQNPIKLDAKLTADELFEMLPTRISPGQESLLYAAIKNLLGKDYTLKNVVEEINSTDSSAKRNLASLLEYLEGTKLFSANPTKPDDLVKEGKLTIIDLKEANPDIQQIVVFKLAKELFNARKYGKIPEFFFVLEEAHNFCPERGLGEVASSKILRTIASEGRKFGVGLCIISQRPAKVDKNVLSQCSTQIILKVTNPNDIRAIMDSVEGIELGTREEIKDLPVGIGMIVGVTEQPLIIDIRIRKSQHGGEAIVKAMEPGEEPEGETATSYESKLPLFAPRFFEEDVLRIFKGVDDIKFLNYPMWKASAVRHGEDVEFYVDGITGELAYGSDSIETSSGINDLLELSNAERSVLLHVIMSKDKGDSIERISNDLKILLSTAQSTLKSLMEKKLVTSDGSTYHAIPKLKIPADPSHMKIDRKIIERDREGETLDFTITADFVKKVADIWEMRVLEVKPVYYPYWVITHKKKKFLVNALSNRLETDKSKAMKGSL